MVLSSKFMLSTALKLVNYFIYVSKKCKINDQVVCLTDCFFKDQTGVTRRQPIRFGWRMTIDNGDTLSWLAADPDCIFNCTDLATSEYPWQWRLQTILLAKKKETADSQKAAQYIDILLQ